MRRLFAETYAATLARMETTTLAVALADEPTVGAQPTTPRPLELADAMSVAGSLCPRKRFYEPGVTIEGLHL